MLETPQFVLAANLPEDQVRIVSHVERALAGLNGYVSDFASALSLYDFAASRAAELNAKNVGELSQKLGAAHTSGRFPPDTKAINSIFEEKRRLSDIARAYHSWMNIAGRDGSMTIYHFADSMEYTKENVRSSSTLSHFVKLRDLSAVSKRFYREFPDWKNIRDATGHRAELTRNPEWQKKQSSKGPVKIDSFIDSTGRNTVIHPQMMGRRFVATNKGRLVGYELSEDSLRKLTELRDAFFAAFSEAERGLKAMQDAYWEDFVHDQHQFASKLPPQSHDN